MEHLKDSCSRVTKFHAKLDADMLLNFAIHRGQNETRVKKAPCKKNACSQCGVMWQTDATGLQKCDLGLPFIFFH
jgi:hypothetical protein